MNAAGNRSVSGFSLVMSAVKIGGIALFAIAAIWASGISAGAFAQTSAGTGIEAFVASIAFSILAFKGFTTITNSGGEIEDPHRNVGRTIMIAIGICVVTYLLVTVAVASSLTIAEIVEARDYSLAALGLRKKGCGAKPRLTSLSFPLEVL